jgi:hypothetical protein
MPARLAWRATVSSSQRSASLRGVSMTLAPVDHLAIHLEMNSEMKEPEKPTTADMMSRGA